MKRPTAIVTVLSLAAVLCLSACGDDKPSDSLTDADVACLKAQQVGTPCASAAAATASTSTETLTLTTTNTATATATTTVTATN